jgi:hypothetical protein
MCAVPAVPTAAVPPMAHSANLTGSLNGSAAGSILVLDVGSLRKEEGAATFIDSAEQCSKFCEVVPGCNAYTYCADPNGCGSGCTEYTAANPKSEQAAACMASWGY